MTLSTESRILSPDNPHWQKQHTHKVKVSLGIIVIMPGGLYFFERNFTRDIYIEFLQFELIPALAVIFRNAIYHDFTLTDTINEVD